MQTDPDQSSPEHNLSDEDAARLMQEAISDSDISNPPGEWEPPLPEELTPLMPGYSITRILGRGGMGAVYHGIQTNLDREVAIKLLPPELGQNPEFEARFKREAKSMAQLNHPNIVQIFDFGVSSAGHHYISMEYVEGTDLHQLINTGELHSDGALNAISQICDALEYAHSEGFVHRDIKPANMFINNKGILKVGDFGLAKLVEDEASSSAADRMALTMTGVAMGTPHYIAPEQLEDDCDVDQRADIFSLGIMFYEMLTGDIPRGVMQSPSEKSKHLDVRIDGVVFKAMDSNPGDRYQSAADFRTDVDAIRSTPEQSESVSKNPESLDVPPRTEKRHRSMLSPAATILLIILLLAGFTYALVRPVTPSRVSTDSAREEAPKSSRTDNYLPIQTLEEGSLHGLVYDKTLKKVVPLWIPPGWRYRRFVSMGATKADGNTGTTAFNWWAVTDEGQLYSQYNKRQMTKTQKQTDRVLNYHHEVGVTLEGTLFAGPDFYPLPVGNNFVDARRGNNFAIALTESGDVQIWQGNNHKGQLSPLPADRLRNIQAISAESDTATILDRTGKVTHWHREKGIIQKELTAGEDIMAISSMVSVSKDGKIHSIGYSNLEIPEKVVDLDYGRELLALKFESGDWRIYQRPDSQSESCEALIAAFEATPKKRVIDLFVDTTGGKGSAIAIWLEEGIEAEGNPPAEAEFPSTESGYSTSPLIQNTTRKTPYVNSLGMQFVPVPITGGPTDGQKILFSAWETRVADYQTFFDTDTQQEWLEPEFSQEDDHPAVRIPFAEANAFCVWLTTQERKSGNLQAGEFYRLPTDHEWSCAAGIGHLENPLATPESKEFRIPDLYYWGRELPPPNEFGNFYGKETGPNPATTPQNLPRKPLTDFEDAFDRTAPVGSFHPNAYGLYDLEGNAFEWCQDWYSNINEKRTLRGGSWGVSQIYVLLTSARIANSPTIRFDSHGFRCVLAVASE